MLRRGILAVFLGLMVGSLASAATFSFSVGPTFTTGGGYSFNDGQTNNQLDLDDTVPGSFTIAPLTTHGDITSVLIRSWFGDEENSDIDGDSPGGGNETDDLGLTITFTLTGGGPAIGPFSFVATPLANAITDTFTLTFGGSAGAPNWSANTTAFTGTGGETGFISVAISGTPYAGNVSAFNPVITWSGPFNENQNFYAWFLYEVPEPGTFLLLGGGLAALAFFARRRRSATE